MAQPTWNTAAGSLGTYPAGLPLTITLSASAIAPATSITYTLLSGYLSPGLSITSSGVISGSPDLVTQDTSTSFAIRATDNLGNIRDRTFSTTISGSAIPEFTTPPGSLLNTNDSVWVEFYVGYSNPETTNPVEIYLLLGQLPPGLELTTDGLIYGYPAAPVSILTSVEVTTGIVSTSITNIITCVSTANFRINRPIVFTGTVFGGIEEGNTYYIRSVINNTTFTISATQDGPVFPLGNATGFATATLPSVSVGQPTIRTYSFSLGIDSPLGGTNQAYSITVINQNTPLSSGGPGYPENTRVPALFNTRPPTFNLTNSDPYYGYYLLPPADAGYPTYPASVFANIGTIRSGNYFAFKVIGHDFDGSELTYAYTALPLGLTGDTLTGWITGTPTLSSAGVSRYSFSVAAYKSSNLLIQTPTCNLTFTLTSEVKGVITWITPSHLGSIFNGTISTKSVLAESDVTLEYQLSSGALPPNLTLLSNGEITGYVADQPTTSLLENPDETEFTFSINVFSPSFPAVTSTKTFTLTVVQEYNNPIDTLYIKATPSIVDRNIINTLLDSDTLIPSSMLYRPNDIYFGKASQIVYEHAYGIYASDIEQYIAAVTINHYWRNITLGAIETAVAKDENGVIIYEVVYSKVIDNLINPQGQSVSSEIYWPRLIDLGQGPWYTSITDIYTSYADILGQEYYTSLTPGYARSLYPNSLYNMRNRVGDVLGQEYDNRILPLWMTSQQQDGSTLGYTQAWVICYTKPGYADIIKNNINTLWKQPDGVLYKLNMINFKIDRFFVDKRLTYDYNNYTDPASWSGLPSATPTPDPANSKDFYVLFPRTTILPDETQY